MKRSVFFLILFTVFNLASGMRPLLLEHLDKRHGLESNYITDIETDSHDFIWVATEGGLSRFDGNRFTTITERNSTLSGNAVNTLFYEEGRDRLWVGTKQGLDVIDCASQRLLEDTVPGGYMLYNIVGFASDHKGGLWIVNHYDNIVHYDPSTGKTFAIDSSARIPMAFRCVADDGKGHLYIGHASYGFSVMDIKEKSFVTLTYNPSDPRSLPGNDVKCMLIDRYGNVWVGTDHGLALYNPVDKDFTRLSSDDPVLANAVTGNINTISEMADGSLWIGTNINEIMRLDIGNLSLSNPIRLSLSIVERIIPPGENFDSGIMCIRQDGFGNVWAGSFNAGVFFAGHTLPQFELQPLPYQRKGLKGGSGFNCFFNDGSEGVWAANRNEIVRFKDGEIQEVIDPGLRATPSVEFICALHRIGDEVLFSVREQGVFAYSLASKTTRKIPLGKDLNYANLFSRTEDGRLLAGAQDGLYEYRQGCFIELDSVNVLMHHLIPDGVVRDRQGKTWVGTYGGGVFVFDKDMKPLLQLRNEDGFSSNAVKDMMIDSRGWIWVAGQDGCSVIKDTSNPSAFTNLGYEDGLDNLHIHSLTEDAKGNVWITSENSLIRWNANTEKLENYRFISHLPSGNLLDRASVCAADGSLYFGTSNGILRLPDDSRLVYADRIPLRITGVSRLFPPSDSSDPLLTHTHDAITLDYESNTFRIAFASADYSQAELVEYSYLIEGVDKDWLPAGSDNSAVIHNLAPGEYTFKVRARFHNQDWDDENVAALKITVKPPFWQTWYAKLLYLLMFVTVVYIVFRFYKRRLEMRNEIEMERRKSIDAQELNDERIRFFTNITHELRTPLTLILGPLEDLSNENALPDSLKPQVGSILGSARRLLELINKILEFRKTETQNFKLTISRGNLANLVTESGMRYQELNRNPKVKFKIDIDNGIDSVFFDRDAMTIILSNLLSNAIKYTPEGSVTLSLHREGDKILLKVADTGYGIEEKAIPHIFDRYYQAKGKHQASGTGIGLALVKSIVDLHHCQIDVESQPGKGSLFTVTIPADYDYPDEVHADTPSVVALPETAEGEASGDGTRPSVLVVEDNDDIREYIERALSKDYRVKGAADGKEGLDLARETGPAIIVSDIMMPVMDGIEMCREVKTDIRTSHIPVILLTAKDSLTDKETGYDAGADSYLTKPFSAKLLQSRIRNILQMRQKLTGRIVAPLSIPTDPTPEADNPVPTRQEDAPTLKLGKIDRDFLEKFTNLVNENISNPDLDIAFLRDALNMSQSTLYRKVKGLTGMSAIEFIRKIRLRHAYDLINDGNSVSVTAYACGFNDVSYFSACFREEYGKTPSQLQKAAGGVVS